MAVLDPPQGYECEFLDSVPDELLCKKCTLVARRLVITGCCGESFCQTCIADTNTPCPACGSNEVSSFKQVKNQRLISNLRVYCSMKERGCVWSGPLDQLDTHLDPDLDNCQYVDTKCPLNCLQTIPKNKVEQLAVKTELKLEEQDKILQTLDDKFQEQNERLQKQDEKHSEEEDTIKEKIKEQDKELVKLEDQVKDQEKISESYASKLKLLEEKLQKIVDQSKLNERTISLCVRHLELKRSFVMENFSLWQAKDIWKSPAMYTHVGGYKFFVGVVKTITQDDITKHDISVGIWSMPGEFDHELEWPASAKFSLQVIQQKEGKNLMYISDQIQWKCYYLNNRLQFYRTSSSASDLILHYQDFNNFLVNDSLHFEVSKIEFV